MTRILIVSASVGSGHARAAAGLEAWIAREMPGATVQHLDILTLTSRTYRKAYTSSYIKLADHAPELWGYLYDRADKQKPRFKPPRLIRAFDKLEFAKFRHVVRDFAPDQMICTHFLPVQVLASSRRKPWAKFGLSVVVTDYYAHGFWAQPAADRTFLPTQECLEELVDKGMPRAKLLATGIPLMPQFAAPPSRDAARAALNLPPGRPLVLAMGGGWGGGGLDELAAEVLRAGDATVLAIAGRNTRVKAALERMNDPRLRVFGFVDNIHELMAAADLCVTKSGGLTTSECLATGLPMLIPNAIPGQEERNANYVAESGAAMQARSPASLRLKLARLLSEPALLRRMSENARAIARPTAAQAILRNLPQA
ncbi:MAG: glycosyltransferase [Planctomycetes bacterium]|nr:glycosyltransferase [Planctomycetota bacterium]